MYSFHEFFEGFLTVLVIKCVAVLNINVLTWLETIFFLFVEFFSDEEYENYKNLVPRKPIKAKKELGLEDLPPIEDLKISVSEEDCIPVGKVYQIVDQLGNANNILKYKKQFRYNQKLFKLFVIEVNLCRWNRVRSGTVVCIVP